MAQTRNIIIIGAIAILVFSCFYFLKSKPKNILLLGGLDYRQGDLNIEKQAELLEQGSTLNVKGFRYNNSQGIIKEIEQSKDPVYVVLFSKGGQYSHDVALAMNLKKIKLSNLYIVEPYASSSTTLNSVRLAVSLGVPSKNVIVGKSKSVGLGVVENTTSTPSCSPSHWCSLKEVGEIIANK
jgi:hypothetical protein